MINDEKMSKLVQYFSMLPDDKQDYVLGILQALVFACYGQEEPACNESCKERTDEIIHI